MAKPLRIAIVSGEESGDLLGFDLVRAIERQSGRQVELVGVGGRHLQSLGLKPMFDPGDIALMGVSAVVRDLPRLVYRIGTTARAIADAKPDCLITIDSPAFTLRVAKKVRALDPAIPIVKYVCPSVWAWNPGRAPAMRPYIDRILCILPFEEKVLEDLKGPMGIYVGHRLASDPDLLGAAEQQRSRVLGEGEKTLLVLPGSRRGEVRSLMKPFGETLKLLQERGNTFKVVIPTVPHVAPLVAEEARSWPVEPVIVSGPEEKLKAFAQADAAMAASGTVLLELALARVPMVSCYKTDLLMSAVTRLITIWTAALPNLIADRLVVQEFINEFLRPGLVARQLEALLGDTQARGWQLAGLDIVAERMRTERPSSEVAAEAVLELLQER
ncbi:lipid-A-disaccharide synthase [Tianweitania sp. BSSL-BM11]|uniref:Lipid-A-disaccharide synthase n=2 Tax=Tianweitania aestuarii TaxID=2814886 RepID=A0ABS5RTW3_9HYPH|nr:lipid-A-disaccharide synthase [Tianweitania aestuarii]MBS9720501.1 lipid-A-disaccharide synthase [Tianweitania aestuarii]